MLWKIKFVQMQNTSSNTMARLSVYRASRAFGCIGVIFQDIPVIRDRRKERQKTWEKQEE
jgi:hypothetical protein